MTRTEKYKELRDRLNVQSNLIKLLLKYASWIREDEHE